MQPTPDDAHEVNINQSCLIDKTVAGESEGQRLPGPLIGVSQGVGQGLAMIGAALLDGCPIHLRTGQGWFRH